MKKGRRLALLLSCVIGLVGVFFTLIESIYFLLLGRVIFGFSVGMTTVIIPRFIEEMVPYEKLSSYSAIYPFSSNLGSLIATSIGGILPDDKDIEG